jgi:RNA polymerase sigma-70 factor, ECF subfamily
MRAVARHDHHGDGAPEEAIRAHHARGDLGAAATLAVETYGPEIYGFLRAIARDDAVADDAFSTFAEHLWRGLAGFRWEASLRTWAYALARNALHRVRRDPARRAERNLALSRAGADLRAVVTRTATSPFLRTDVKDRFATLRERLDPDDHALLILRIDRRMSWRDIAGAMPGPPDAPTDDTAVARRAAALRKRFERAKAELKQLAAAHGLLGE